MKKSMVMTMALVMGISASAYAANPFSDVPAGHWAYDAVAQLAAAGVVNGYGTVFGGEKLMTRYEMAQVVAKAMAKGVNTDKLSAEFADELDALGVRVAKLEKKVDNVKITGNIRYSYRNTNTGAGADHAGYNSKSYNRFRTRLWVNGAMNEDWQYTGMLEQNRFFAASAMTGTAGYGDGDKVTLAQAYVTGRLGGMKVKAGRVYFKDVTNADNNGDGIQVSYGSDWKVTGWLFRHFAAAKMLNTVDDGDTVYRAMLSKNFGKLNVDLAYWKFDVNDSNHVSDSTKLYNLKLAYPLGQDLKLSAEYLYGDAEQDGLKYDLDRSGYYASLEYKGAKASKPGSWGVYAAYMNRPYATVFQPSALSVWAQYPGQGEKNYFSSKETDGYKGWEFGASYAPAKNIIADLKYADYAARKSDCRNARTAWFDVMFMF